MKIVTLVMLVLALTVPMLGCVSTPQIDAERAADANAALGISYLRKGQPRKALNKLKDALSYNEDHVRANWGMALVYSNLDSPDKARSHYERALEHSDSPAIMNSYGAFLCAHGRPEPAVAYFERAVSVPTYANPAYALANAGICLRRRGQTDRAVSFLKRALKQKPSYAPALSAMARLKYANAEYFGARAYFQRLDAAKALKDEILLLAVRNELALDNQRQAHQYLYRYKAAHPQTSWTLDSLNSDE